MNDPLAVRRAERVRNLNPHLQHLFQRQRLARNAMLQRRAVHEFHGNKRLAVQLANFINRADMRMIQRGRRPRLSPKTLQRLRVLGQCLRKKL